MLRLIRRSLTAKILLAFSVAVLIGVGGVAVLANVSTRSEFESYLTFDQPVVSHRLADVAAATYRRSGSWDQVGRVVNQIPRSIWRVVIADPQGMVVVDTGGDWVGQPANALPLRNGIQFGNVSRVYGTLYLVGPDVPGSAPPPRPFPRPFGLGSVNTDVRLSLAESTFLQRVNQSVILAALGGILAALVIGGLLARQIIHPLREVTRGAQRIAHGHLGERIGIRGDDEVGQLAQAFNQMAESLQQTEDARRQLVADVAHELRTPLTVIGGTVQAMRDGVLPTDDANLEGIYHEVTALTRLVADLRDLSLADVGQFTLQLEELDLRRVLDRTAAAFNATTRSRGIALDVELPDTPLVLEGDEARLGQCFQNLVDNALRHTPPGGRVTLRARPGQPIEVAVIDTGAGIASEHLSRVFERFYRADPSRARRSGGSGLGLAIVQQIVRAHGGEISAESPGTGKGATFHVLFPAIAPAPRPAALSIAASR
jgi:signal transduction histidine kinase